jgi:sigma-E factor negative regulatory protein RseB
MVSSERVAGRRAVVLAIRPHDDFRYGHRIWLDAETGFPLQTRLIGAGGDTVEQVKFADIRFDSEIQASALAPSMSTEDFRWFTNSGGTIVHPVETSWRCDNLPPGFRIVSAHQERFPGSDGPVIHLLYSDGLANVSVFIEPATEPRPVHKSRVGASSSYSVQAGPYRVTAVGDVPGATVEQIAASIRPNP